LKLSTMACLAQGYRQVFIVHMEQITIHCKAQSRTCFNVQ
jgi:hypothetical protein